MYCIDRVVLFISICVYASAICSLFLSSRRRLRRSSLRRQEFAHGGEELVDVASVDFVGVVWRRRWDVNDGRRRRRDAQLRRRRRHDDDVWRRRRRRSLTMMLLRGSGNYRWWWRCLAMELRGNNRNWWRRRWGLLLHNRRRWRLDESLRQSASKVICHCSFRRRRRRLPRFFFFFRVVLRKLLVEIARSVVRRRVIFCLAQTLRF